MPIRLLDPKTVARIAAGEVIERPASVVKELVENALDADAAQVVVEVRGGGIGFIRVIDNGRGIPSSELELAFQRHATSKLERIEDLDCLDTLGFRGEALPSIAAVAEVEVSTSTGQGGDLLSLRNGEVATHTGQARPRGTTVTVRNLFRNVPARLKFLKSNATENGHIANVVTQYALARPTVKFTLLIDGRNVLLSSGSGRLLDVVVAVYGPEVAQKMVALAEESTWQAGEHHDIRVEGMVSAPTLSRAGRDALSFFVNRRAITNRSLAFAVEDAYQGLLMQGRHPVAVISISLPPAQVDVNVHPTKSEVKFQDERAVFGAVQRSVRNALASLTVVPTISDTATAYRPGKVETTPFPWTLPRPTAKQAIGTRTDAPKPEVTETTPRRRLPALRIVGQVGATYIVGEGPEGMYVIDQHAAHERVLYEKIRKDRATRKPEVQGLLEPATLQVTPRQDAVMQESMASLKEFGFDLEPFGERSYLVRAVPAVLGRVDFLGAVREFLDDPTKRDRERGEAIVKTLACHGAVRAGKTLTDEEMRELVRLLEQCDDPFHCPHGRPTLIGLSGRQLEREFGRG